MARGSSRKRTNNNNRSNHSQADDAITNSINPTILQCLQEFEQEAQQRNQDKYLFTIRKAIRSVQKYPLPLLNGQQCRMLEGIGPVLAQKIDFWLKKKGLWQEEPQEKEQQEEEEANNGDGADDDYHHHHGGSSQATNASSQQQSQRAEESQSSQQQQAMSQQQASASRAPSRQQSSTALVPPPKKAKSNRKYIPKFKSASWAMLIALYRHYKKDKQSKKKSPAGLTKSELIAQCSHMSDTPMVAASSGKRKTYSYCGWNSMKSTLMEKKLVSKGRGRSHRFALTPDGLKLARKLHIGALELFDKSRDDDDEWSDATDVEDSESSEEENKSEEETESQQLSPQKRVSRSVARSPLPSLSTSNTASSSTDILEINSDDSEDDQDMMDTNLLSHIASQPHDTNQRASSIVRQSSSSQVISPKSPITNRDKVSPQEKLRMSYLNASHKPVPFKDQAQVHISCELGLVFLCQIVVPSHITIDESKLEENLISLNNKTSSAFIDIDLMKRFREQDQKEGYEILLWLSDDACGESSTDLVERFFTNKQSLKLFTSHSITTQNSQSSQTLPSSQPIQTTSTAPVFLSQKTTETNKKRKRKHDESINLELTQMEDIFDFQTYTQPSQQPSHGEPLSQRRRLSNFSENYQLILVVDQRERHNNDRSYIVQQLEKTGINVESSQLGVGDFLWIARSKDQKEEHVLNFIIERKAVDDLAASIIDGRYKEQRFRLRQISEDQQAGHDLTPTSASCLNVIYLIEGEYSRQKRLPVKNIQNALVRLQVSDQFQVKQTLSIAQSIEYLANMTKVMEKLLQDKGLDYCRLVLEDDGEIFEPNLRQFNCYATKSGSDQRNLSPSHLFARQLCCIHGCSPQIAKAIIERFASNARDFIEKVSSKEGIEQLSNVKIPCGRFQGVSVRKIGPALSKSLASYYTSS